MRYQSTVLLLAAAAVATASPLGDLSPRADAGTSQFTSDATFKSAMLAETNLFRKQHNATAVTWDSTLASFAQKYIQPCNFEHSVSSLFIHQSML
jgi:uncharacterized protein YkwD